MKLSLVLALALLGAVSARQLHEGHLQQEGTAEPDQVKPGEPEPPCPMESEIFRLTVQGSGGRTYRYVAVSQCQPFGAAQSVCARCYRGCLASVHSSRVNERLRCLARSRTNQGQVWIGGMTTGRIWCRRSQWIDRSPWNYAYWASGNVRRRGSCVALCTAGGHWRNVNCGTRLPFVCEY